MEVDPVYGVLLLTAEMVALREERDRLAAEVERLREQIERWRAEVPS